MTFKLFNCFLNYALLAKVNGNVRSTFTLFSEMDMEQSNHIA